MNPQLSVIIPAFNEEQYIGACLLSLANQSAHGLNFEIIIVNDASTDGMTQKIAEFQQQHPNQSVRVIEHQKNEGRFKTRLDGIHAAAADLILLLDAKITLTPNALRSVQEIAHVPLIATQRQIVFNTFFDRVYFLTRRQVYFSTYPKVPGSSVFIEEENFNRCPKGTGCFLCQKSLLLNFLPEGVGKDSSDDTKWLRAISKHAKIMIHNDFEILYTPRQDLIPAIRHLYDRGPKFVDYYYSHSPAHRRFLNVSVGVLIVVLALLLTTNLGPWIFAALLCADALVAFKLSRNVGDFVVLVVFFPLIVSVFGAGLLRGLFLHWTKSVVKA